MKKIIVTEEILKKQGACKEWRIFFNQKYPKGINIANNKNQLNFKDYILKMKKSYFINLKESLEISSWVTRKDLFFMMLEKILLYSIISDKSYYNFNMENTDSYSTILKKFNESLKLI